MTGTTPDEDISWGRAIGDIGGSLVRACLEEALIDVDGLVQEVAPLDKVESGSVSPTNASEFPHNLGIGGVVYAKILQEVAQEAPARKDITTVQTVEPHPEPGPSKAFNANLHQEHEASSPGGAREQLEKRLLAPHAPAAPASSHPSQPRRYGQRPKAAAAALAASPTAPTPAVASRQLPLRERAPLPKAVPLSAQAALARLDAVAAARQRVDAMAAARQKGLEVDGDESAAPHDVPDIGQQVPQEEQKVWHPAPHAKQPDGAAVRDIVERLLEDEGLPISPGWTAGWTASAQGSPTRQGTREVLQGALEEAANNLTVLVDRLPAIQKAAPTPMSLARQNQNQQEQLQLHLPSIQVSQPQEASDLPREESPSPLISEQQESKLRRTPLYLRMQRNYEAKEQKAAAAAQERRRAEMAGLAVYAVPAPRVFLRRKPRSRLIVAKKAKDPTRRRSRPKKKIPPSVASAAAEGSNSSAPATVAAGAASEEAQSAQGELRAVAVGTEGVARARQLRHAEVNGSKPQHEQGKQPGARAKAKHRHPAKGYAAKAAAKEKKPASAIEGTVSRADEFEAEASQLSLEQEQTQGMLWSRGAEMSAARSAPELGIPSPQADSEAADGLLQANQQDTETAETDMQAAAASECAVVESGVQQTDGDVLAAPATSASVSSLPKAAAELMAKDDIIDKFVNHASDKSDSDGIEEPFDWGSHSETPPSKADSRPASGNSADGR